MIFSNPFKVQLSRPGLFVAWALVCVTIGLFLLSKPSLAFVSPTNLILTVSQVTALCGITLLSFTYFLSSRAGFLEKIFGGLDQVYRLHHLMGVTSFILLITHPVFLILNVFPYLRLSVIYLLPTISGLDYDFGILAFYTLIILVSLTLFVRLPYHIWKSTHEYMGIVIFLGFLHTLLIESDISRFLPLRIWILSLTSLGLLFHFYRRFFYDRFGPVHKYQVNRVSKQGAITEIFLSPLNRPLRHHPGQFVFVKFSGFPRLAESHPFSISSAPGSSLLRLSIKRLGDYTERLNKIEIGTPAVLSGPYGLLYSRFNDCDTAVCIAGGIGITPFISLFESKIRSFSKPTYLFYSVKNLTDAYYSSQLLELSRHKKFFYRLHNTAKQGRITAAEIINKTAVDHRVATYFICGPLPMMISLRDQLLDLGVKPSRIIFEDFNLK